MRLRTPCTLLAAATIAAALAEPTQAGPQADEELRAVVGQPVVLKFPGNRDAGYRWTYNPEQSRGAHLVEVQQLGWTISNERGSLLYPKPQTLNVSVTPKAPGEAVLAFEYLANWGNRTFVKSRTVRLLIGPGAN